MFMCMGWRAAVCLARLAGWGATVAPSLASICFPLAQQHT